MENLCTNCGTLDFSIKKHKGTVGIELLLLFASVFGAALNLIFGGLLFIIFVIYCVWRLTSKQIVCPNCQSANVIPPDSPLARNLISQMYKANH